MFFRWDDRPGLSRKFDDHSNNSEMPKGITFRCKIEKTIKQKLDTSTIKFWEQGSQAMLSHVGHSSVSGLVQNSAQKNNQNVAPLCNDIPGRSLFKYI